MFKSGQPAQCWLMPSPLLQQKVSWESRPESLIGGPINVRHPWSMMGIFFHAVRVAGWRMAFHNLLVMVETRNRGQRGTEHPNRWKWSDKLPHSPLSVGTSGLNPRTFFKLSHSFGSSLANQSADFCRGPNIAARNMPGCKVSDCGGDYQSGREDARWPPLDPPYMSSVWLAGCLAFQFAGWCDLIPWSHFICVSVQRKEKQIHTVNRFHLQLLNDINKQLVPHSLKWSFTS